MARKGSKKIAGSYDNEFRFLLGIDSAFEEWRAFAAEWLGTQKSSSNKRVALAAFFVCYLHNLHLDKRPASLLDAQFNPPNLDIPLDLAGLSETEAGIRNGTICDFLDWVLRKKFAQSDAQGHRIVPPHLRNPFARLVPKRMGKGSDLEFCYVLHHDPQMEDWRALAAAWLDKQRLGTNTKRIALDKFLIPYVVDCNLERNPYVFLRRDTQSPSFMDVLLTAKRGVKENGGASKATADDISLNNHIHNFLAWVLSENLSVEDDNGHRVIPHEFHNPLPQLSQTGAMQSETLKTPLPTATSNNCEPCWPRGRPSATGPGRSKRLEVEQEEIGSWSIQR